MTHYLVGRGNFWVAVQAGGGPARAMAVAADLAARSSLPIYIYQALDTVWGRHHGSLVATMPPPTPSRVAPSPARTRYVGPRR